MIVYERCLAYLESREGKMIHKDVEDMEEILDNLKEADKEKKRKEKKRKEKKGLIR